MKKIIITILICVSLAYLWTRCYATPTDVITSDAPIATLASLGRDTPMMPIKHIVTAAETTIEETTLVTTEVEATTIQTSYYDIPLPEYLQTYTIEVCREYNINPLIIFAMMEVESLYTIDIIGDNGNAVGILQIHPRWHQERANKLNVSIYEVEGNILVAVDLLTELLHKYGNYGLAITAYNRGTASEISEYGKKVLKIASTIEIKNEENR